MRNRRPENVAERIDRLKRAHRISIKTHQRLRELGEYSSAFAMVRAIEAIEGRIARLVVESLRLESGGGAE